MCVSNEKEFMCQTCHKLFASKLYLKEHNKVHSSATRYSCNTSNKSYKYRSSLRHHEKTRHLWLKWWAKLSILLFVFSIYWYFVLVVSLILIFDLNHTEETRGVQRRAVVFRSRRNLIYAHFMTKDEIFGGEQTHKKNHVLVIVVSLQKWKL